MRHVDVRVSPGPETEDENDRSSRVVDDISLKKSRDFTTRTATTSLLNRLHEKQMFVKFPRELLEGDALDLRRWSWMLRDEALEYVARCQKRMPTSIGAAPRTTKEAKNAESFTSHKVISSVADILRWTKSRARNRQEDLTPNCRVLNIHGADYLTDVGLQFIGDACSRDLASLNIGKCVSVTDAGVRHVTSACVNLTSLDLSGLGHLRGTGLVAIGILKNLKCLSLAKCSFVKDWLLTRITNGCPNLMDVNLEGCNRITVRGFKALGHHCRKLVTLNLNSIPSANDEAILHLSQTCRNLQQLSLYSGLSYAVTDVGLLALAERCVHLRELDLRQCSSVSDAGIGWLAQHCHRLVKMNLAGCTQITDVSMRSLSDGCGLLQWIALCDAKRVTDVGIRYLSMGCKDLKHVDARGLVFLTDGVVRDFGKQGLQFLADNSASLAHLNIRGAFQVGKKVFQTFGQRAKGLRELVASHCPEIDSQCIRYLASGCPRLEFLDVSHNARVADAALIALGHNCKRLTKLNVKNCELVSDRGVVALVKGCRSIEWLNLEGCTNVSDISLLTISELKLKPGIRLLNLAGLHRITETGISWLAQSSASLLSLNVKGCAIAPSGLAGLKESWSHLQIKKTLDFYGLAPVSRARDKRFVDEYRKIWNAAVRIQCVFRRRDALRQLAIQRDRYLRHWSTKKLQAHYRGLRARRRHAKRRNQRRREVLAAIKIQTIHRRLMSVHVVSRKRKSHRRKLMLRGSKVIQRHWRGCRARRAYRKMIEILLRRTRCEDVAVRKIQRVVRGYRGRRIYEAAIRNREIQIQRRNVSALRVQRAIRAKLARMRIVKMKREKYALKRRREKCSRDLQRIFRGYLSRRAFRRAKELLVRQVRAATRLQAAWRAKSASAVVSIRRTAMQMQKMSVAARKVQSQWRARQGRLSTFLLRRAREMRNRAATRAAIQIQKWWRGYLGRKSYRIRVRRNEMFEFAHEQLLVWAATKMQSVWRGNLGRKRAVVEREKRSHYWKVLYDDEKQRSFYYNKHTTEIRWRKPQPLLDMMEIPTCDNCGAKYAAIECAHCEEFFCDGCYGAVHYGGKRKAHPFRALFDYYQKRIDYGDGEFPSKWPSEIVQDELRGWHERSVDGTDEEKERDNGEWSKCVECTGPSGGHELFVNRLTNKATYERPKYFHTPRANSYGVPVPGMNVARYYDEKLRRDYYYDLTTGDYTYEKPSSYKTPRAGPSVSEPHALEDGRVARFDEETGAWLQ